jgi:hypothetical protein
MRKTKRHKSVKNKLVKFLSSKEDAPGDTPNCVPTINIQTSFKRKPKWKKNKWGEYWSSQEAHWLSPFVPYYGGFADRSTGLSECACGDMVENPVVIQSPYRRFIQPKPANSLHGGLRRRFWDYSSCWFVVCWHPLVLGAWELSSHTHLTFELQLPWPWLACLSLLATVPKLDIR